MWGDWESPGRSSNTSPYRLPLLMFQPSPSQAAVEPVSCSSPPPSRGYTPTSSMTPVRRGCTPNNITVSSPVSRGVTPTNIHTGAAARGYSQQVAPPHQRGCTPTNTSGAVSPHFGVGSAASPHPSSVVTGKSTPDPVSGVTPVLGRKEARSRFSLIVVSALGLQR